MRVGTLKLLAVANNNPHTLACLWSMKIKRCHLRLGSQVVRRSGSLRIWTIRLSLKSLHTREKMTPAPHTDPYALERCKRIKKLLKNWPRWQIERELARGSKSRKLKRKQTYWTNWIIGRESAQKTLWSLRSRARRAVTNMSYTRSTVECNWSDKCSL